jgi:hypothetical protein
MGLFFWPRLKKGEVAWRNAAQRRFACWLPKLAQQGWHQNSLQGTNTYSVGQEDG